MVVICVLISCGSGCTSSSGGSSSIVVVVVVVMVMHVLIGGSIGTKWW